MPTKKTTVKKTQKAKKVTMPQKKVVEKGSGLNPQTWAAFCHLSAFIGYVLPFGMVAGPLVLWIWKKDELEVVDTHGKAAVNFQLSMVIYLIISLILMFVLIGFVLFPILLVFQFVCIVLASLKAKNGEFFHYPFSIQFLK